MVAALMKSAAPARWHWVLYFAPLFLGGSMFYLHLRLAKHNIADSESWTALMMAEAKFFLLAGVAASALTWLVLRIRRRFEKGAL